MSDLGRASGDPEHSRDREAVDVGIDHTDLEPFGGQRGGEVDGDR